MIAGRETRTAGRCGASLLSYECFARLYGRSWVERQLSRPYENPTSRVAP